MKIKLYISIITITLSLLAGSFSYATSEEGNGLENVQSEKEYIFNEVYLLKDKDYASARQTFTKTDITAFATRDFKDEVEGDHQGGWSDQGSNDFRDFTLRGENYFLGIPFDIIEPNENNGKSVLVLRGQNEQVLPYFVEIPVNNTAKGVYFLQTTAYSMGANVKEAEYSFVYEDGSVVTMELLDKKHLSDFWGKANYETCQVAYSLTRKSDNRLVSINVFALSNPYPEKRIKSLRLESVNQGAGAYIMVVGITLTDSGPYLPDLELSDPMNPMISTWIKSSDNLKISANTAMDNSAFLDAPAGKYGKVKANGNHFVFENGDKVRFWGANLSLSSSLVQKDIADTVADDIARCGYNIVRFNNLDLNTLDEDTLDALFCMIGKLKERGIYTYLTFNQSRQLSDFFDKQSIERQKSNIKELLTKENPYTKICLADEPAVAMVEFISRSSFLDYSGGYDINIIKSEEQKKVLKDMFNNFLYNKYKNTSVLKKSWSGNRLALNDWENIEEGTVGIIPYWRYSLIINNSRKDDTKEFLAYVEKQYYSEMSSFINKLGYKGLSTGNSNSLLRSDIADVQANSNADFIARNGLWATPYGGDSFSDSPWISTNYKPKAIVSDESQEYFEFFGLPNYSDVPVVISEYNEAISSLSYNEINYMMAVYSGERNWNPIVYSYLLGEYNSENKLTDFYSIYNNPTAKSTAISAARLFYGWDRESNDKKKHTKLDTDKGRFLVDTPYAQGAIGSLENYTVRLSAVDLEVFNNDCAAVLTSCDGDTIEVSNRMLLTVTSGIRNYRMQFLDGIYNESGISPIHMKPTIANATLKVKGTFRVWALSSSGERMREIQTYKNNDGYTRFNVNRLNEESIKKSINFEIVRI